MRDVPVDVPVTPADLTLEALSHVRDDIAKAAQPAWRYRFEPLSAGGDGPSGDRQADHFQALGAEGWEYVGIVPRSNGIDRFLFKQPYWPD